MSMVQGEQWNGKASTGVEEGGQCEGGNSRGVHDTKDLRRK